MMEVSVESVRTALLQFVPNASPAPARVFGVAPPLCQEMWTISPVPDVTSKSVMVSDLFRVFTPVLSTEITKVSLPASCAWLLRAIAASPKAAK